MKGRIREGSLTKRVVAGTGKKCQRMSVAGVLVSKF